MKRILSGIICLLMVISLLAACGGNTANTPAGGDSSDGKKVINYANGAQPEAMDPVNSNYLKYSTVKYNIYCGLTHIGENGVAELAYATDYTVSDDGLVWTFSLRPDSKYSDGSPLVAQDWVDAFKFNVDPVNNARSTSLYMYVKNVGACLEGKCTPDDVGVRAIDENTVEFTLENPCSYFLDLCATFIPYRVDIIKSNPSWAKTAETYITNGPFRVVRIEDQVGFYCEKNPYYYNAENVKIDELNFIWIDDEAVELASYKNNTINISDALSSESKQTYENTTEFQKYARIGVKYLTCNTEHITDYRIRQALAYAIDRQALIKVLNSAHNPANGLVPYGIHWGNEQWRDVADSKNGGPLVTYDLEKARQLLADAGYPDGKGLPTYTYICYNSSKDLAQALQSMWQQIGVNIEIVGYESSTYWDVFDTDNWDIGDDGWTGDFDDPNTNLFLWEEYRQIRADGTLKDARWHNEKALEYDRLLKATYVEQDYETRMELFRQAELIICEDMPVLPVFYYNDTILIKPEITGVVKSYLGHTFFEYADIN